MSAPTFTMNGRRFVVLPEVEYRRLRESQHGAAKRGEEEWGLPPLPAKALDGTYPALEYTRVTLARDIIRSRRRLGLSQTELARHAGIRVETLNRIERARITPSEKVMAKIDAVLGE